MDFQMPVMDGIEATKRIKEMISRNEIHNVIIIGCSANDIEQECAQRSGYEQMDYILPKPISEQKLIQILKAIKSF